MNLNKRNVETKHVHNDQNENQITTRQRYSHGRLHQPNLGILS